MNEFNVYIRPVCISCSCEMSCASNGVYLYLKGSFAYVSGDLYKCPKCGHKVVSGFAKRAFGWEGRPGIVVAEIEL